MESQGFGAWTFECLIPMGATVWQGHVPNLQPSPQRPHGDNVRGEWDGVTGLMSWVEEEGVSPSPRPVLCAYYLLTVANKEGIKRHRHFRGSALLALGLCQLTVVCQQGPEFPPEVGMQHPTCCWQKTQMGGSEHQLSQIHSRLMPRYDQ